MVEKQLHSMGVKENTLSILQELTNNASKIEDTQAEAFIRQIKAAKHIFLGGAGRSGIAIQAFANRLMHLGFSVSIIGEISSPHSHEGDLLIICSGSGETGSLKSLAAKASDSGVDVSLITMKQDSTIAKLAIAVLVLPGTTKDDNERDEDSFSQPMGSAFEQLAFLSFDAIILTLMDQMNETSDSMFKRHADFE